MNATPDADELHVSRSEHGDQWTVTVDFGPAAGDAVTVEIVGDTAIVAVDAPGQRTEFDVPLPEGGGDVTVNNGILTVESAA
ncbi:DUF7127 family protein [Haloarcula nitratireducens]|uniref:Hsp20/alpha crystallin family protein n=1 Tax=Haloarcula nitratireducens TaxID=2487749 RepID=A0AAW4PBU9_9EURY|nr:hypothetical protein [Halomicroarcula nitratireducens]MBX0295063.1 hypothetical protein [Halomicroarcula nitratireducens]